MNHQVKYPNIFSRYRIRNTTFKNRIFAAPVTVVRGIINGLPTREGMYVYENRARNGFALVTVNETFIDFEYAARHDHCLDLVSPGLGQQRLEPIAILTEAVKSHGAKVSIQFNHTGNTNHPSTLGGKNPIGPSHFIRPDGIEVDEMDEEMIHRVADNYAHACDRARIVGFDMVMLHGGHGWLLSQFTSPLSNWRKDKWGGSLENRARFALLVLDKIREKVGDDLLIEYRVSGDECVEGGMHLEETIEFCKMIQDKVDVIHVTSGIYHSHVETKMFSSIFDDHGHNIDLAAPIKAAVKIPVAVVGGFNDPVLAERFISEGKCDFVALGRQQLADPEWVNKALTGREDEIAPCLRCSCFNPLPPDITNRILIPTLNCAVNPRSSRELRMSWAPAPSSSKNVLVIGGGVGGMYAAITAAERGHKVTLAEKEDKLGGLLWLTEVDIHKNDLKRFKDSLITKIYRLGVKVELNTEATNEYIELKNPYAVICAVGSEPVIPEISGIEKAHQALYAYSDFDKLGQRVVMIGGGLTGCEIGFHLANLGKTVHILEMLDDIAIEGNDSHRRALIPRMKKILTWDVGVTCSEIKDDGVYAEDREGGKKFIEADSIIYAVGMKPRNNVVESFRSSAGWFVPVGDCVKPRRIEQAVYEGFIAAMDIL